MRFAAATTVLFAGSAMASPAWSSTTTVTQTSTTLECPASVTDCPLRSSTGWAASDPTSSSTTGWVSPTTAGWVSHSTAGWVSPTTSAYVADPSTFKAAWSGNSTSQTYKATGSADWTVCDCEDATPCSSTWTSGSTGGVYSGGAYGNGGSGTVVSGSGAYSSGASSYGGSGNGTVSASSPNGIVTAGAGAAAPAFMAVVAGLIAFLA
jgi:hypothetical protein